MPRGLSHFISVLERIICKVVADFTGMLHTRHPYELGGAYWLFNMAYTQFSIYVVLHLRGSDATITAGDSRRLIGQADLWTIAIALTCLWVVAILVLLKFSEEGFRHTFYQTTRAWEYVGLASERSDNQVVLVSFIIALL